MRTYLSMWIRIYYRKLMSQFLFNEDTKNAQFHGFSAHLCSVRHRLSQVKRFCPEPIEMMWTCLSLWIRILIHTILLSPSRVELQCWAQLKKKRIDSFFKEGTMRGDSLSITYNFKVSSSLCSLQCHCFSLMSGNLRITYMNGIFAARVTLCDFVRT